MPFRLDYLRDGPPILIHGDDRDAVCELARAFGRLYRGALESLEIHALRYIDARECRLLAVRGERDRGARQLGSAAAFEWIESPARWGDVAGLVCTLHRPPESGHQYLAPSPFGGRGIKVELSVGERWAV